MIVASLRSTGRSGAEVGNMWKSVLSSIHSDKSIEELKKLGVAVKTTTGDFRPMQDVLSDVMIAMAGTEKNTEEVTKAMAGGKFQWAKLASSLGDVETYYSAVATSIASTGKANEYMAAQMDTVSRKASQLHQSLIALISDGGAGGLNSVIKSIIDNLRYFVDGLNNGGMQVVAFGGATYLAVKAIQNISLAIKEAEAAGKAWNVTTAISEALMGNWAAIAGAGILIGVVGLTVALGKQASAEKELLETQKNKAEQQKAMIAQYDDEIAYVKEIEQTRAKLISSMEGMSDADDRKIKLNGILSSTEKDLSQVIGEEGLQHLKAAGFTKDAFAIVEKALQDKQNAEKNAWENSSKMVQKATDNLKKNILTQIEAVGKATEAYGVLGKLQENGLWLEKSAIYARYQLNPTPENAKAYDDIQAQVSAFYQNQSNNRTKELIAGLNALGGSSSDISLQDIPASNFKSIVSDDSDSSKAKKSKEEEPVTGPYADLIRESAKQNSLSATLLDALVKQESSFNASATSSAGAMGLTQLMPLTAKELGVNSPYDPAQNLAGGARYLREMMDKYGNDIQLALAAFNAGSGTVDRKLKSSGGSTFADIKSLLPTETQNYVDSVYSDYSRRKSDSATISDISKTKIETPTYTDPTDAILRESAAQANLTAEKNKSIQTEIDQAKSSKDYTLAISKTNELIKSQATEMSQLNEAHNKINALKDNAISSSPFGDTSRWFDANNEQSTQYLKEFNSSTASVQKAMEAEYSTMLKLRKAYMDNKKSTDDLALSQKSLQQSLLDIKGDVADQTIETMKAAFQKQEELTLKSIENEVNLEESRHQGVMDDLDEELSKREEVINAQITALDRLADAEDYNKSLNSAQSEAQDIQNQINVLSNDTSFEGKARTADLQKQLAEKNSSIDDIQSSHSNDLRKQALQDQLEATRKDVEAKKQAETEKYNLTKKSLEDQKNATETTYTELMNNEQYWATVRQQIIQGNIDNIKLVLAKFYEDFTLDLTKSADTIKGSFQEVLNMISKVKNAASNLDGISMSVNSGSGIDPSIAHLDTGGKLPSWGSGGKLAILHQNEVVLNDSPKFLQDVLKNIDMPTLLKSVSVNNSIGYNVPQFDYSKIQPKVESHITSSPRITFNVTAGKDGLSKKELSQASAFVLKDIAKMLKK